MGEPDTISESRSVLTSSGLFLLADTVAREKGIDRSEVIEAIEQAIQKAGHSKYGNKLDIRAEFDRTSGEIHLARYIEVVDEVENEFTQITVDHARDRKYDAAVGEFFVDPLPSIDFGRIAVQAARRAILTKAHDGRREWEYAEFKNRVGEVINARVKRVELGVVIQT